MSKHSVEEPDKKNPHVIHEAVHWDSRALFFRIFFFFFKLATTALPYHMLHSQNATLVSFQT